MADDGGLSELVGRLALQQPVWPVPDADQDVAMIAFTIHNLREEVATLRAETDAVRANNERLKPLLLVLDQWREWVRDALLTSERSGPDNALAVAIDTYHDSEPGPIRLPADIAAIVKEAVDPEPTKE